MKTIRRLSNRKLDELQDRLSDKYWLMADTFPVPPHQPFCENMRKMLLKIGIERMRRIGLIARRR